MIAQTVVEYGFLQTISESVMNLFSRMGHFLGTGSTIYFILAALALIAVLLWSRCRAN